jgi:putative FmdB family regulatory protein
MPLYEYECEACGERLERLQKLADPPLVECPACGAPRLRRLVSTPAFQFKGSGWYVTDYARKGREAGKAGEQEAAKGDGEAKPAADASGKPGKKDAAPAAKAAKGDG